MILNNCYFVLGNSLCFFFCNFSIYSILIDLNCSFLHTSFLTFEESTRQKFKNLIDFGTYHFYLFYGINSRFIQTISFLVTFLLFRRFCNGDGLVGSIVAVDGGDCIGCPTRSVMTSKQCSETSSSNLVGYLVLPVVVVVP
jgi:hypothetical protein